MVGLDVIIHIPMIRRLPLVTTLGAAHGDTVEKENLRAQVSSLERRRTSP
jgi:hypothetical protein